MYISQEGKPEILELLINKHPCINKYEEEDKKEKVGIYYYNICVVTSHFHSMITKGESKEMIIDYLSQRNHLRTQYTSLLNIFNEAPLLCIVTGYAFITSN